jgi:hypothetical protein
MPTGTTTSTITEHTRLANGVDHLLLRNNSRQAADGLLGFLGDYLTALPPHPTDTPPLLLMVELAQSGMPPLAHLSHNYQLLLKSHPTKQLHARIAYVYTGGFMLPIVRSIFSLIRNASHVQRQYFPISQRDQAIAWLLEQPGAADKTQ